ncbi:MAG: FAD-dependent oxidoreductase, partial [Spirochaetota bacterium]
VDSDYVVFATLFPILDHSLYAIRMKPVQHHGIAYSYEKREFDGMFIGVNDISFRYYQDSLVVVGGDVPMGHAEDAYLELDRKARERFAVREELARWSAHDYQPPDSVPFIGPYHPGSKRRFAATGFKAWGITHAMIASRLITDMVGGRENAWAELYSPTRMHGALRTMAEQGKSAFEHLVKGGRRCPHMGCSMSLNEQDRTYDCPCHGSRFSETGEVLWGPAVENLR